VTGGIPSDAADTIYGYAGNDTIDGVARNDWIDAESGADTVRGGNGDAERSTSPPTLPVSAVAAVTTGFTSAGRLEIPST
jgi:Ca2+-binding RTX toxin-like protein